VTDVAYSVGRLTDITNNTDGFEWPGKDPNKEIAFDICRVSLGFANTVGWKFIDGRDFSKDFASDSDGVIINETAAKYLHLKNPVGEIITKPRKNQAWTIVGVIKDMVMLSPYEPVNPTFYYLNNHIENELVIKMKTAVPVNTSLEKIETGIKRIVPSAAFNYTFADEAFAQKFSQEQRVGKLAAFFAVLAIFISCLGLLGLASFVAEQRTKEIGIRKVLGASILNLWQLLSKEFVILVTISCLLAVPISNYYMEGWLEKYQYRTNINWWIFALAIAGALSITLLTVSFQAIKAAMANPVKSLRTE